MAFYGAAFFLFVSLVVLAQLESSTADEKAVRIKRTPGDGGGHGGGGYGKGGGGHGGGGHGGGGHGGGGHGHGHGDGGHGHGHGGHK